MSRYIISLPAARDLQTIADYFALENVDVGERLLKAFNQKRNDHFILRTVRARWV